MNHISKLFIFLFIFKITIFSYNSAITDITYKDEKRNRIFHTKVYYPTLDIDKNEMNQLIMELSQPTYMKNGVGKLLVNKQPDGAVSPNRADSVMICFNPAISSMLIWDKL